jgi:hypothetical protein
MMFGKKGQEAERFWRRYAPEWLTLKCDRFPMVRSLDRWWRRCLRRLAVSSLLAGTGALLGAGGADAAEKGYIVIRNLNPPHDCRVIGEGMMFIATYSHVYGPVRKGLAERYARKRCKPTGVTN